MKMFKGMSKWMAAGPLALSAGAVQASMINVAGVNWDPEDPADWQSNGNVYETFAGAVGDTVSGFGEITQFNGDGNEGAGDFCPGCELTFTFSMELASATPLLAPDGFGGFIPTGFFQFEFENVSVKFFADASDDYDQNAPSLASAENGVLFLDLVGSENLIGTANQLFDPNAINGSGVGFLDVIGGVAADNFDTNTKKDGADIQFTSSFQPAQLDVPGYPLFGSVDLAGDTIPAPASVLLFGLGLLGLGAARRRK